MSTTPAAIAGLTTSPFVQHEPIADHETRKQFSDVLKLTADTFEGRATRASNGTPHYHNLKMLERLYRTAATCVLNEGRISPSIGGLIVLYAPTVN